jgi:hypothetical protein
MKLSENCDMATPNEATRAKPNGYISAQYADKTSFYIDEALVDLETIVNASLSKEDIYRLVGRAIGKLHRANDAIDTVREICKQR